MRTAFNTAALHNNAENGDWLSVVQGLAEDSAIELDSKLIESINIHPLVQQVLLAFTEMNGRVDPLIISALLTRIILNPQHNELIHKLKARLPLIKNESKETKEHKLENYLIPHLELAACTKQAAIIDLLYDDSTQSLHRSHYRNYSNHMTFYYWTVINNLKRFDLAVDPFTFYQLEKNDQILAADRIAALIPNIDEQALEYKYDFQQPADLNNKDVFHLKVHQVYSEAAEFKKEGVKRKCHSNDLFYHAVLHAFQVQNLVALHTLQIALPELTHFLLKKFLEQKQISYAMYWIITTDANLYQLALDWREDKIALHNLVNTIWTMEGLLHCLMSKGCGDTLPTTEMQVLYDNLNPNKQTAEMVLRKCFINQNRSHDLLPVVGFTRYKLPIENKNTHAISHKLSIPVWKIILEYLDQIDFIKIKNWYEEPFLQELATGLFVETKHDQLMEFQKISKLLPLLLNFKSIAEEELRNKYWCSNRFPVKNIFKSSHSICLGIATPIVTTSLAVSSYFMNMYNTMIREVYADMANTATSSGTCMTGLTGFRCGNEVSQLLACQDYCNSLSSIRSKQVGPVLGISFSAVALFYLLGAVIRPLVRRIRLGKSRFNNSELSEIFSSDTCQMFASLCAEFKTQDAISSLDNCTVRSQLKNVMNRVDALTTAWTARLTELTKLLEIPELKKEELIKEERHEFKSSKNYDPRVFRNELKQPLLFEQSNDSSDKVVCIEIRQL